MIKKDEKGMAIFTHFIEYIALFPKQQSGYKNKKILIRYFFIVYMVLFLFKTINEDITLRYLNFLSTHVRPLRKSVK